MTAPVVHGYPDWNRAAVEADAVIISQIGAVTTVGATFNPGYVGNYKSLYVLTKAVIGNCRVALNFFADAALTIAIDSFEIDMQSGDVARQPVNTLGPYLQVQVIPGPVTPITFNLSVTSAPAVGTFDSVRYRNLDIGEFNTAIGAATTVTRDPIHVLAGEINWVASMSGGNWFARLFAVDKDNTTYDLDTIDNGVASLAPRRLWVPPAHLRVTIKNNAAAGAIFNLYLTRKRN